MLGRVARAVAKAAKASMLGLALGMSLNILPVSDAAAANETRSLKLYFVHTGERAVITYKRNGRFDPKGLQELNRFLRDWRRNEPTRMDPRLFDLVWEVYRRVGASDYIHVVSAYRSPNTNGMLRSRTKGVAKNSQHMLGKAMDFFIPGVKLSTLRETAMKLQVGGVGFYPSSGSPFVHLDVGGVRAWPRMSRQDLVRLFPNGNTVHLPADGQPLPGYEQAVADYKRRVAADSIQIAGTAGGVSSGSSGKSKNLFAMLFGGGDEEEDAEESAPTMVAQRPAPTRAAASAASEDEEAPVRAPVAVATATPPAQPQQVAIAAPVPLARPAFRQEPEPGSLATALYSPQRDTAQQAIAAAMPASPATPLARPSPENAGFADLASMSVPVPTLLGPRGLKGDAQGVATASLGQPGSDEYMLASVPVPAQRPALAQVRAETVAAATAPQETDKQALTPDLIAELARTAEEPQSPSVPVAAVPVPAKREPHQQVALASPAPADTGGRGMIFNDGFDPPKPSAEPPAPHPARAAQPKPPRPQDMQNVRAVKGGAVTKLGGTPATPDAKVLTGDILAKWASSNSRPDPSASTKAPRLMTRVFSTDSSSAYSGGFRPVSQAVAVDPNRFSDANPVKP